MNLPEFRIQGLKERFWAIWRGTWLALPFFTYRYDLLPCCKRSQSKHACTYIRVLSVNGIDSDNNIRGSLRIHNVNDPPAEQEKYHCLSYTWGDPFDPPTKPRPTWTQLMSSRLYGKLPPLPREYADWFHNGWANLKRLLLLPNHWIICDGSYIGISQNLADGLRTLLAKGIPELRNIWVDQICINQRNFFNHIEKSSQVGSMHILYEMAESMIIWLGPEDRGNENIVSTLRLAKALSSLEEQNSYVQANRLDHGRFYRFNNQLKREYGYNDWISARRFLQRTYFSRLWIFQEIISHARSRAFCGEHEWKWDEIYNLSQAMASFGYQNIWQSPRREDWLLTANRPHEMESLRQRFGMNREIRLKESFVDLVFLSLRGNYSCSIGHDILYAALGVCKQDEYDVNYDKPVEEVYTDFWRGLLVKYPNPINMLAFVEDYDEKSVKRAWKHTPTIRDGRISFRWRPPMPSWIPDLQVAQLILPLSTCYGTVSPDKGESIEFYASGRSPNKDGWGNSYSSDTPFSIDQDRINTKGYCIGVASIVSECSSFLDPDQEHQFYPKLLDLITYILNNDTFFKYYTTTVERIDAICATIAVWEVWGRTGRGSNNGKFLSDHDGDKIQERVRLWLLHIFALSEAKDASNDAILSQRRELFRLAEQEPSLQLLLPSEAEVLVEVKDARDFMIKRWESTKNGTCPPLPWVERERGHIGCDAMAVGSQATRYHRFFNTTTGYLGKGPTTMQPGDEIWILIGGRVPFVLRKGTLSGNQKLLIGQAYVHGVMRGELVSELEKAPAQSVCII